MNETLKTLMKTEGAIQQMFSAAYKEASPEHFETLPAGLVPRQVPTLVAVRIAGAHETCECGKRLEYVFDIQLPVWFCDKCGLEETAVSLGSECIEHFAPLFMSKVAAAKFGDRIKAAKKKLKLEKTHGQV
jgi:hypothetical protein